MVSNKEAGPKVRFDVTEDVLLGGHREIVDQLLDIVDGIGHRDMAVPRVVLLTGASGTGKSRIIREVYEGLLKGQSTPKYWTDLDPPERGRERARVDPMKARKELGPRPESFEWPALALPDFGWWTFSCDRNSTDSPSNVLADAALQLNAHLPALTIAWRKKTGWVTKAQSSLSETLREVREASLDEGIGAALDELEKFGIKIPIASSILRVLSNSTKFARRRVGESKAFRADIDMGEVVEGKRRTAGEDLADIIGSLTYAPSGASAPSQGSLKRSPLPAIVLVEDAHLMDEAFAGFLKCVSAPNPAMPVLVIATGWPEGFGNDAFEAWIEDARRQPDLLREVSVPELEPGELIKIVYRYAPNTIHEHAARLVARLNSPHFLKLWLTLEYTREDIKENGNAVLVDDELVASLPEDVVDILRMRWKELPFETKKALELAAVTTQDLNGLPRFLGDVLIHAAEDAHLSPTSLINGLGFAANPAAWCVTENESGSFRELDLQDIARASALTQDSKWHYKTIERARASVIDGLKLWIRSRIDRGHLLKHPDDSTVTVALWLTGIHPDDRSEEYTAAEWVIACRAALGHDYLTAISQGSTVVEKLKKLAPDHPDTLNARNLVAMWLVDAGQVEMALEQFTELLADHVRVLGPDHPDTLDARNSIAFVLGIGGRVVEAIEQLTDLLKHQIGLFGADNRDTMTTRSELAFLLTKNGRIGLATEQVLELLADQLRVLGPQHPETLRTRGTLAHLRGRAGQVGEAIDQLSELVADEVRALGPDDPETLATRGSLAHWLGQAGKSNEALDQFTELVADQVRVLGPDHRATLRTRYDIAFWMLLSGESGQALERFTELLKDSVRALGEEHGDTKAIRHYLPLAEAGQINDMVARYTAVLADQLQGVGPEHPETLATRNTLAHWLGQAGRVDKEMEVLSELLAVQGRMFGMDHPDTLTTRYKLAMALGEWDEFDLALEQLSEVLEIRIRVLGPSDPQTLSTRNSHAFWLGQSGKLAEAIEELTSLLVDQIRVLGSEHAQTVLTRDDLANLDEQDPGTVERRING